MFLLKVAQRSTTGCQRKNKTEKNDTPEPVRPNGAHRKHSRGIQAVRIDLNRRTWLQLILIYRSTVDFRRVASFIVRLHVLYFALTPQKSSFANKHIFIKFL